ncbi:pyroglutamyl peptidase [Streptomyces sp. NPDC058691]|uniref:pyroglutamyl peptidase n=1 Tax=Streptomyces sp. NPDC058691 TaxID=3346601 RepID=UPI00366602EB
MRPPTRTGVPALEPPAGAPSVSAPASAPTAAAQTAAQTAEEARLDRAAPQEILRRSGFDAAAPRFARALAAAHSRAAAQRVVRRHGRALWQDAVGRAQGRVPAGGDLSRDDDRPLYWARLALTRTLRAWQPSFPLGEDGRAALLDRLERSSRGMDGPRLPAAGGVRRILLTGFDPFRLDADVRRSNPSGAAALALDGVTIRTAAGPARVHALVFPVRWDDFTRGTVERALRPWFRPGPHRVDLFATVSQGRDGRFDLERFNGAWRGGHPDNAGVPVTGPVPVPYGHEPPQWTTTGLPYQAIVAAGTGPFPVHDNTAVTEIPAGATVPVAGDSGPTPGSTARAGGGGDYLSNEIAYRATLLRDELALPAPGGHVHTPVLQFGPGNTDPGTGAVTDPGFLADRLAITAQLRAILIAAAGG